MLNPESAPTTPTAMADADPQEPDVPVASAVMPRFAASFLDLLPILGLVLVVMLTFMVGGQISERLGGENPHADGVDVDPGVLMFLAAFFYIGATESRRGKRRGQTFGKQAGLRTVTARGALPPSLPQIWTRAACIALLTPIFAPFPFFSLFDAVATELTGSEPSDVASRVAFLLVLLVTGLTAFASTRRRTWFDRLTGTTVIAAPKFGGPEPPAGPQSIRGIPVSPKNALLLVGWVVAGLYTAFSGS